MRASLDRSRLRDPRARYRFFFRLHAAGGNGRRGTLLRGHRRLRRIF